MTRRSTAARVEANDRSLADIAFDLHERGAVSRDALVDFLGGLVNAAAIENGYASEHGLPFNTHRARQSERRRKGRRP